MGWWDLESLLEGWLAESGALSKDCLAERARREEEQRVVKVLHLVSTCYGKGEYCTVLYFSIYYTV